LPKELLSEHSLSKEIVLESLRNENECVKLCDAVYEIASLAHSHLQQAKLIQSPEQQQQQQKQDQHHQQHHHHQQQYQQQQQQHNHTHTHTDNTTAAFPLAASVALLPVVSAEVYLQQLQLCSFNVFDDRLSPNKLLWHIQWKLLQCKRKQKF